MTPWAKHKIRWSGCRSCELCETRKKVVLLRGDLPAQILFVGEAPGVSEDTLGVPFIGLSGQLLDRIIASAFSEYENPPSYALTNLVACIPVNADGKAEPTKQQIQACAERLQEIVGIVNPSLIIHVGALSEKWACNEKIVNGKPCRIATASIIHPAAILRMNVVQQPLAIKRAVVTISDAIRTAFNVL